MACACRTNIRDRRSVSVALAARRWQHSFEVGRGPTATQLSAHYPRGQCRAPNPTNVPNARPRRLRVATVRPPAIRCLNRAHCRPTRDHRVVLERRLLPGFAIRRKLELAALRIGVEVHGARSLQRHERLVAAGFHRPFADAARHVHELGAQIIRGAQLLRAFLAGGTCAQCRRHIGGVLCVPRENLRELSQSAIKLTSAVFGSAS